MALTDAEVAQIVTALQSAGIEAPPAPGEQPVHPALAEVTPEQSLLASFRIEATPDALATLDAWLVGQGYVNKGTPAGEPSGFKENPQADDVIANLLATKA